MDIYSLRPYLSPDTEAVVDVINASSMHVPGFPRAVVDAVGALWFHRFVPFTSEKIVAVNGRNEVVGYAYFTSSDNNIVAETGGAVHPDHWKRGVGTALLAWAEERGAATSQSAPPDIKTVLQTSLYESEADAITLFKDHGYAPVREWMHLVINLIEQPRIPALSSNLFVREMDLAHDWDIVDPAMEEAFADHWGETEETPEEFRHWLIDTPRFDRELSLLARDGPVVAGYLFAWLDAEEDPSRGYVAALGTRRLYRGRGIAEALLRQVFRTLLDRGKRGCDLHVDSDSLTGATRLYERVGMTAHPRFATWEKELRPGSGS